MQRNVFYIIGLIFAITVCLYLWHPEPVNIDNPELPMLSLNSLPESMHGLQLKSGKFYHLFGWEKTNLHLQGSMKAFLNSCKVFLNHNPDDFVGSDYISLYARDWVNVCHAAGKVDSTSAKEIKDFFEHWFIPVEFVHKRRIKGLFTGYYVPIVKGSLEKTDKYQVPLYAVPKILITANLHEFIKSMPSKKIVGRIVNNKLVPFYTREEIDSGVLGSNAQILAYVETEIDRLKIETEGSAIIDLGNNSRLVIGFAGTNGAAYRAIASILIDDKILSKHEATMQNIKKYFKKYPDKLKAAINQNKSFVFFRRLPSATVVGSQGVPLTGESSLAVDRRWIPQGMPLWVTSSIYDTKRHEERLFDRLMIAQDAGGSIKGIVRGDIYFGEGLKAEKKALSMHSKGHYWLLLPRMDRVN